MSTPADAIINSEVEVIDVFEARRGMPKVQVAALLAERMSVEEITSTFKVSAESICEFANEAGKPVG